MELDRREGNRDGANERDEDICNFMVGGSENDEAWQLKKNRISRVNLALSGMEIIGILIDRPGIRG
jgi:hypothetical protein